MAKRSRHRLGARARVFGLATLLLLGVIAPMGPDRLADAGTAPLSDGGYTAFVASAPALLGAAVLESSPTPALLAINAGSPGMAQVSTTVGAFIDAVAIDPTAQEVLATEGAAGVQAFSAQSGLPIGAAVPLPGIADAGPIAISPDGHTAWVGDWDGRQVDSLSLSLDTPPTVAPASITLPLASPPPGATQTSASTVSAALALSPDGSRLYVGAEQFQMDTFPISVRLAADTRAMAAALDSTPARFVDAPSEVAAPGSGGAPGAPVVLAYSQPGGSSPLWSDSTVFASQTVGSISAMQLTPDGSTLYVAAELTSGDETFPGGVSAITSLSGPVPANSPLPLPATTGTASPTGLAVTPDGRMLYILDTDSTDPGLMEIGINGGPGPAFLPLGMPRLLSLAVTPTEDAVLVVGSLGLIPVAISPTVPLPSTPGTPLPEDAGTAIAVTPDQAPVASLRASPTTADLGATVTFDASTSTVLYGAITKYVWDFGDGSAAVTTAAPTVTHVYGAAGDYTATVVETDAAGTSIPPAFAPFPVDFTGQTALKRADASAQTATSVAITNPPPTTVTTTTTTLPPTTVTTVLPTTVPPTTASPTTATTQPTTATTLPPTTATTLPPTTVTTVPATTTTTQPTTPTSGPTTTTAQATTTTTTTLPPPPPPDSPALTVNPGIGAPGIVTQFSGQNFPDNTAITVQWSPGIGSVVVTSSPTGTISGTILILYRDAIGNRTLTAVGYPTAVAPFLVVPDSSDPAGSSGQFLFRR